MKLILNDIGVIMEIGEQIVFAKHNPLTGGLGECDKEEATHIWNIETNIAYMVDTTMVELEEVPEEVKRFEYKYIDGIFEQYELEQLIPVTMELDEPIIEYDTTGANKPK